METEQIQLDLKKLNEEFNDELYDYYEAKEGKIICDDKYNIKDELTDIKKIWSDLLYKKCREVIKSKSNDKKVDENEVKKFYDEQLKKYENSWELDEDSRECILKSFCTETINSSKKVDELITFTKYDLKFKDIFYDNSIISTIISLVKFGEGSTVTKEDLFKILELNQEKNLSLSVLLDCVKKFNIDFNDYKKLLSYVVVYEFDNEKTENKQGKIISFSTNPMLLLRIYQEVREQNKVAEEKRNNKINTFFDVLCCLFTNSKISNKGDKAKDLQVIENFFAYINNSRPCFKHLFREIDEHENGLKLLKYLYDHDIKISLSEQTGNNSHLKVEISYFRQFNEFVLQQYNNRHCDSIDALKKIHDDLVSQFIEKIKNKNIDVTEGIKEDLLFDDKSLCKILGSANGRICKLHDDFEKLMQTINLIQSKYFDIDVKQLYTLIDDNSLKSEDVFLILKLDQSKLLTLEDICNYFIYKVGVQETYSYNDMIHIFKITKDVFRQFDESEIKTFCKLLAYCFTHVDENEAEYIKFEQDIFDWIAGNMPNIKFSNEILKSSGLEDVLSKRCIKLKFVEDNIQKKGKDADEAEDEEVFDSDSESDSEDEKKDKKNNGITVEPDFSHARTLFEDFVNLKINKINTKWKALDEVSLACNEFIDSFLEEQKTKKTIVLKINKTNKRNQEQLKKCFTLCEPKLVHSFFEKISPNIIKSSNNLKRFFQTIGTVLNNCKRMANDSNFMDVVVNLIANNAVSVDYIIWYLRHFQSKENKFELNILLKVCQKIQKNQKWNLKQVKEFLGYGKINKNETVLEDINRFFGLLIIFVNNADLKYSNDNKNIIGIDNIKSDMTYEKFVNEILVYAKDIYFTQEENFSWVDYIDKCENGMELKKILDEKKINIPELQQNKSSKNTGTKNEKIKNKEKNKINIETDLNGNHEHKIDEIYKSKKLDLEIKATNNMDQGEKYKKLENMKLNELNKEQNNEKNNNINVTTNTNNENKLKANLTYSINKITNSTGNKDDNISQTTQKIGGIPVIQNSKRANIQDQGSETTFTSTTKVSYLKLISKIVLYVLAVVALVVLIFSIIKAFWFLTILSFILCFCFAFIAYKIKYKTIDERPNQISTGDLNYKQEITKPKNNELNQKPETAKGGKDKNNNSFSPNPNYK